MSEVEELNKDELVKALAIISEMPSKSKVGKLGEEPVEIYEYISNTTELKVDGIRHLVRWILEETDKALPNKKEISKAKPYTLEKYYQKNESD